MIIDSKKTYDPIEVDEDFFAQNYAAETEFYSKARKLPENMKNVLFGEKTPDIIKEICERYLLNSGQSSAVSRTVRRLLVSEIYLGDVVPELQKQLGIPGEAAQKIANDLAIKLLNPASEDIKRAQQQAFPDRFRSATPIAKPVIAGVPRENVIDLRET